MKNKMLNLIVENLKIILVIFFSLLIVIIQISKTIETNKTKSIFMNALRKDLKYIDDIYLHDLNTRESSQLNDKKIIQEFFNFILASYDPPPYSSASSYDILLEIKFFLKDIGNTRIMIRKNNDTNDVFFYIYQPNEKVFLKVSSDSNNFFYNLAKAISK